MPVFFTDLNNNTRKLMPTPFVTVSKEYQKAGDGEMLGCTYSITLTGTIVATKGSPQSDGGWITTDVDESPPLLTALDKHKSVLNKMKAISDLFSSDNNGGKLQVDFSDGQDGFSANVEIQGVDFSEGNNLVQKTSYSVSMTAYILYGPAGQQTADKEEFPLHIQSAEESWDISETDDQTLGMNVDPTILLPWGSAAPALNVVGITDIKKVYTITHSMSATGKPRWDASASTSRLERPIPTYICSDGSYDTQSSCQSAGEAWLPNPEGGEAWQQALVYIMTKIGSPLGVVGSVAGGYATEQDFDNPVNTAIIGIYGMNIPAPVYDASDGSFVSGYQGFNYGRTQTIDKKGGSVSVTETWTLADSAYGVVETFDISISGAASNSSEESGTDTITLSGTIRGLVRADGENYNTHNAETDANETKYTNALFAWKKRIPLMDDLVKITANVYLCSGCGVFFRSKPDSQQVGVNVQKGEITYSYTYSSKPQGDFGDGVQNSSITINDTHPANVIATTPILGRIFGPILHDMGAVTAYKRSLSLSLTMNVEAIGLNRPLTQAVPPLPTPPGPQFVSLEVKMKLLKPSNFTAYWHTYLGLDLHDNGAGFGYRTIQEQLRDVISAAIPNELGIIKYRVDSAPTESWDVKTGQYSFNISWIYEKVGGAGLIDPASAWQEVHGLTVHPAMSTGFVGGYE
jgi:hypothetical protein